MSVLDDLVPTPIRNFTTETVTALRTDGKQEGLYFEFKGQWPGAGVAKSICAFANAYGGFLVLGATQAPDGKLDKFPGLDPTEEWPLRVKDQVVGHISAFPRWEATSVASPDNPDRRVVVVRVEASDQTPHVLTSSGQIYQRTGSASDPVRDKATIDQLVVRGETGRRSLEARIVQILATPKIDRPAWYVDSWRVEVVSIPVPMAGVSHRTILTSTGYAKSGEPFPDRGAGKPHPIRLLDDGVLLEMSGHDIARFTDGSVLVRFRAMDHRYVVSNWVSDNILFALEAQSEFSPPVQQCFLWVRVGSIGGMSVATQAGGFASGKFREDEWGPASRIVGTADSGRAFAGEVIRRLMRAAGLQAFEPED